MFVVAFIAPLAAGLKVKANFCRQRPRSDIVRSAEGGEKVVECVFVGDIDSSEAHAPLVLVAVEEVVFADGGVEEAAW